MINFLLYFSVLDLGFINWNSYTANSYLSAWDSVFQTISIFLEMASVVSKEILEDFIEESLKIIIILTYYIFR